MLPYIEAAMAMGMNTRKRLLRVELPLSHANHYGGNPNGHGIDCWYRYTCCIDRGRRFRAILFLLGIDRNNTELIILGAIPAALLGDFI